MRKPITQPHPIKESDEVKDLRYYIRHPEELPDMCCSTLPSTGEVIVVKNGETGYYQTEIDLTGKQAEEYVARANQNLGVTPEMRKALEILSMRKTTNESASPLIPRKEAATVEALKKFVGSDGKASVEELRAAADLIQDVMRLIARKNEESRLSYRWADSASQAMDSLRWYLARVK